MLRSCLKAAQIDGHLDTLPLLGVKVVMQRHLFYGDESSDCEVCAVRVWTLSREGT